MRCSCCRMIRYALTGVLLLSILLASFMLNTPSSYWLAVLPEVLKTKHNEVTVLVWHWPFGNPFELNSCRSRFNIVGCHLTADRELYGKSDGVLIHHREIASDLSNLPKSPRPSFQKWVWMNFISPSNTKRISGLKNLFNLTISYRQDADINLPYGSIIKIKENEVFVPNKNKWVCWIVNSWKPEQKKVVYYKLLRKWCPISMYGEAVHNPVTKSEYKAIVASCKFYLAFENSAYPDYITQKLYNALILGSVPVVMGPSRQNYEKFIPGDAFIHVEDFPSPQALAKHLLYLDNNEDMYRKYFNWQKNHRVSLNHVYLQSACYSCDYIRRHREPQSVQDLNTWFWGEKIMRKSDRIDDPSDDEQ